MLASGAGVAVGCCTGADAALLRRAVAMGCADQLRVFTVFSPVQVYRAGCAAAGTCSSSALAAVQAASAAGAAVVAWAGGGPDLPIVPRLRNRTGMVARAATLGGVIVSDGAWGPGSLLLASSLAARGLPVYACTVAQVCAAPGPGWVLGSFVGVPCWRLPAAGQRSLSLAA